MLRRWLSPQPVEDFLRANLWRAPFARPGAAADVPLWLDWSVLDRLLGAQPSPDVLIAKSGRLVDAALPTSQAEARQLMRRELGVVIRQAERHDEKLEALARSFAEDVPGKVHVQIYATPAGTQTFGWHFDEEDVFIVQTSGTKDYYMRANTVSPAGQLSNPDFSAVRRETSPLLSARLIPGDWLYIPRRWWHLVHSVEDALSISIGVMPDRAATNLAASF
jgi:50S ribosomal protein L16 3-hydroxylase